MKFGAIVLLIIISVAFYVGPRISRGADSQDGTGARAAWNEKAYKRPSDKELKKILSPQQYRVARENRDEPAFKNEYWNNDKEGIYVDVISGEPLFSSLDKFRSGSGRPSFTKPLEPDNIVKKSVRHLFLFKRTEIRSRLADSHLGYLYDDGPPPSGLRYSVNSASLRFVPKEDLQKEGYGRYSIYFSCDRNKGVVDYTGQGTAHSRCPSQND